MYYTLCYEEKTTQSSVLHTALDHFVIKAFEKMQHSLSTILLRDWLLRSNAMLETRSPARWDSRSYAVKWRWYVWTIRYPNLKGTYHPIKIQHHLSKLRNDRLNASKACCRSRSKDMPGTNTLQHEKMRPKIDDERFDVCECIYAKQIQIKRKRHNRCN